MVRLPRLGRPRLPALLAGVALAVAGAAIAVLAPMPAAVVPEPEVADDELLLSYVRSLPDAGDPVLVRPVGLAIADDTLYVSDSGDAVVRRFSTSGRDLGELGRGVLKVPAYVASDEATAAVLVTDRDLGAVLRFSTEGELLDELRPSEETTAGWEPLGVAADGRGRVAVTDIAGPHRVIVMERDGEVLFALGSEESSATTGTITFDYPNNVTFFDGRLWVSDSNNRRVLELGPEGTLESEVRLEGVARGVAFLEKDGERYLAVVDTLGSRVVLFDAQGAQVAQYGSPGSSAGTFAYPNDVVYDPVSEQLFVADTGNARVQVWAAQWPGESAPPQAPAPPSALTPMRLFGLGLAVAGVVLAVLAWLLPRKKAGKLL